jgi:undecaprenyl-diphosphatase
MLIGSGAVALILFIGLSIAAHRVPYFAWDLDLTRAVQSVHASTWDAPLHALNWVGFPPVVDIVYGLVILAVFLAHRRREALTLLVASLGGAALNNGTKLLVNRPRPEADLVTVERHIRSTTFPAGHVLNLVAFAGFLVYLLASRRPLTPGRITLASLLLGLVLLMGLARIQSGEHWPSDVLGGYLLGLAWLAVVIPFHEWWMRSRLSRRLGDSPPAANR